MLFPYFQFSYHCINKLQRHEISLRKLECKGNEGGRKDISIIIHKLMS